MNGHAAALAVDKRRERRTIYSKTILPPRPRPLSRAGIDAGGGWWRSLRSTCTRHILYAFPTKTKSTFYNKRALFVSAWVLSGTRGTSMITIINQCEQTPRQRYWKTMAAAGLCPRASRVLHDELRREINKLFFDGRETDVRYINRPSKKIPSIGLTLGICQAQCVDEQPCRGHRSIRHHVFVFVEDSSAGARSFRTSSLPQSINAFSLAFLPHHPSTRDFALCEILCTYLHFAIPPCWGAQISSTPSPRQQSGRDYAALRPEGQPYSR